MTAQHGEFASADTLVDLLRAGATPRPPWLLTHEQRWRWVVDTLLGHPTIRGGQRPRDFPADPASRRAQSAALALHARTIPSLDNRFRERVNFGRWLSCFVVAMATRAWAGHAGADGSRPGDELRLATGWVVRQALLAVGGTDASLHRIAAALGWCSKDLADLPDRPTGEIANVSLLATVMAAERGTEAHVARHAWMEPALLAPLSLVTLKVRGVQSTLGRARKLWVRRGGSAWVSQCLAFARDALLAEDGQILLLTDSDAVVKLLVAPRLGPEHIRRTLRKAIEGVWSDLGVASGRFRAEYPRLAEVLREAPIEDPGGAMVEVVAAGHDALVLGDLARPLPPPSRPEARGSRARPTADEPEPCVLVDGERASLRRVPWLRPLPDSISWVAAAWTLAGSAYRLHALAGLAELVGEDGLAMWSDAGREWLARLGEKEIAYIQLDGDGVGKKLGALPLMDHPTAGLELAVTSFDRLVAGTRGAVEQWRSLHPGGGPSVLPLDPVLLAGDDVAVRLPRRLASAFLERFSACSPARVAPTFTGVHVAVDDLPGGKDGPRSAAEVWLAAALPRAVKCAKALRGGEAADTLPRDTPPGIEIIWGEALVEYAGVYVLEGWLRRTYLARDHSA